MEKSWSIFGVVWFGRGQEIHTMATVMPAMVMMLSLAMVMVMMVPLAMAMMVKTIGSEFRGVVPAARISASRPPASMLRRENVLASSPFTIITILLYFVDILPDNLIN